MNGKRAGLVAGGAVALMLVASPLAFAQDEVRSDKTCTFTGGNAGASSVITGDSAANVVMQAPVGGNNALNAGNCSEFLNNNGNGNGSGNTIVVPAPEAPPVGNPEPLPEQTPPPVVTPPVMDPPNPVQERDMLGGLLGGR